MATTTRRRAEQLVKQYAAVQGARAEVVDAVIGRVMAGECVWHAAAVVTGRPCACYDCAQTAVPTRAA
jgi:hypothetical protein